MHAFGGKPTNYPRNLISWIPEIHDFLDFQKPQNRKNPKNRDFVTFYHFLPLFDQKLNINLTIL